MNIAETQKTS